MNKIKIIMSVSTALILIFVFLPTVKASTFDNHDMKYVKIGKKNFISQILDGEYETLSKWFPGQFIVYFFIFIFSIIKILLPDEEA